MRARLNAIARSEGNWQANLANRRNKAISSDLRRDLRAAAGRLSPRGYLPLESGGEARAARVGGN
jgi:hypothetical protein